MPFDIFILIFSNTQCFPNLFLTLHLSYEVGLKTDTSKVISDSESRQCLELACIFLEIPVGLFLEKIPFKLCCIVKTDRWCLTQKFS